MNLYDRMIATQKTVDVYKGKAFEEWKIDCLHLVGVHAKHMGKPIKLPAYRSAATAAAAMKKRGYRNLADAMDAHFRRIQPHEILLSDIVEVPGQNGFSSLMIALGNGRALGFHEEVPHADVLQPVLISGAWRIEPSGVATGDAGLDVVPDAGAVGDPLANLDARPRGKRVKRNHKARAAKRRAKR
jgi:hypothetical protein